MRGVPYRLGRLTALEAREAQQHAEEAAIRLLEATYAAKKTAVALQRLVGKALPRSD